MDIDLPLAPASRLNSPIVNRTSSSSTTMPEAKAPEKKKISLQKRLAADKQDDIDRKASATEAPVKSRKVEASNNKHVNGGDNKEASKSEKEDSENLPSGYAKQYIIILCSTVHCSCRNYDKMHVNAIEKKRLADTLKEGKELPVYLKAMGLYALAYSQFEHFGPVNPLLFLFVLTFKRIPLKNGKACWSLASRLKRNVRGTRMRLQSDFVQPSWPGPTNALLL